MTTFEQIDSYPDLKKRASAIAAEYGLNERAGVGVDYFWLGPDFAIIFLLDRDGADVRYIDLQELANSRTYFLGRFLSTNRRVADIEYPAPPQLLKPSVLIATQLEYLLSLLSASPDILRGDRTWLYKEYRFEVMRTPQIWQRDITDSRMRLGG